MPVKKKPITDPLKAIKARCLDCSGDVRKEVEMCPNKGCPLYPFRMGKNPFLEDKKNSK